VSSAISWSACEEESSASTWCNWSVPPGVISIATHERSRRRRTASPDRNGGPTGVGAVVDSERAIRQRVSRTGALKRCSPPPSPAENIATDER
jgi:hypothetical protein